ncbi:2-polyprenyl-6-methoxyphenol hydroxylase-like FAD-dependent oxidoreductase [Xanthomonas campestris]|nr:2-polyprenyl-6-methoxyphenol hydroxylase-like FAD-dependent oxidoreductase [Xanthomonas sp. 3075]
MLDGMNSTDDFYFAALRQVRVQRWHKGRVALTGDAAWCATPLAGIGTTLAVTGGYVLANEIACNDTLGSAFAAYAAAMRSMVEQGQGVPKIGPRLMNPHGRLGIRLLQGGLKSTSRPSVQNSSATLMTPSIEAPNLSGDDRNRPLHNRQCPRCG